MRPIARLPLLIGGSLFGLIAGGALALFLVIPGLRSRSGGEYGMLIYGGFGSLVGMSTGWIVTWRLYAHPIGRTLATVLAVLGYVGGAVLLWKLQGIFGHK